MATNLDPLIPPEVHALAAELARAHPDDVSAAVTEGMRRLRRLPNYDAWVDLLVRHCFRDLVHTVRHRDTVATKNLYGQYGGPAKVRVAESEGLARVNRSLFDTWYIGGTVLGNLEGRDLPFLVNREKEQERGHTVNHRVLLWLQEQKVPADQRVRDAVPEEKLVRAFRRIWREVYGDNETMPGAARET